MRKGGFKPPVSKFLVCNRGDIRKPHGDVLILALEWGTYSHRLEVYKVITAGHGEGRGYEYIDLRTIIFGCWEGNP
jgi:hypothetical protein